MSSKQRVSVLCAGVYLSVVTLVARSSISAPSTTAGNCIGCNQQKIRIKVTGDPKIDAANMAEGMKLARERQQKIMETAAARKIAKRSEWHGTRLGAPKRITDAKTIALHESIAKIFADADPPAPASRVDQFKAFFGEGGIRCIGYGGCVESVTPNANGQLVVITVLPKLVGPGVPYSNETCIEVWQLDNDGTLTNKKAMPHPKIKPFIMTD